MSGGLKNTKARDMILILKMVTNNFRKNKYQGLFMPSNLLGEITNF